MFECAELHAFHLEWISEFHRLAEAGGYEHVVSFTGEAARLREFNPAPARRMSATFVLDADTLASLKAKELQNVLEKLNTGGTLTQREWDIIHAHSQPAAPQTSPAPSPSVAPAFSTPADIAAFYSITTATVKPL